MEKQFLSAFSSVFCSISKPHPNLEILAGFVHTGKRLHLLHRADSIDRHERQGADADKELTLGNTVTRVWQKSHLKTIHLDKLMSTEEATIQTGGCLAESKQNPKYHQRELALHPHSVVPFRYLHPSPFSGCFY